LFQWIGRNMQQILITLGIIFLILGLLWPWLSQLPLGRLPGDIHIERENFSFHFPLMTGLVISVVLTLILWWLRK
jgi:ribose/xylose/arabinose/galactoside ABC-type transport system permease subunit